MSQQIKISLKAFGDKPQSNRFMSTVAIETEFPSTVTHEQILDVIYADTNLQQGYVWNLVQPLLASNRTHTSLSVGDEVIIDGTLYVCSDFGWENMGTNLLNAGC